MNINFSRKRRDPMREGQMKVSYAPGKRLIANLKWRLTLLIVLSPFLYFLTKLAIGLFVDPSSGFIVLDIHQYHSPATGMLLELNVNMGDEVAEGELIALLRDFDLERRIEELQQLIKNTPYIPSEPMDSVATTGSYLAKQLKFAQDAKIYQQKRFDDVDFLFQQGAATLAEHNTAQNQLNIMENRLTTAQYDYQQWLNSQEEKELTAKPDTKVAELREKLSQLLSQQERLSMISLHAGKVTEVFSQQGQEIQKGNPVVAIARNKGARIIAYVAPEDINKVQSGEVAIINLPSGVTIRGFVDHSPGITGRLPSFLSTPMIGRQRMIVVYLNPLNPIPATEMIDGLPVEVHFETAAIKIYKSILSIFK